MIIKPDFLLKEVTHRVHETYPAAKVLVIHECDLVGGTYPPAFADLREELGCNLVRVEAEQSLLEIVLKAEL